MLDYSLFINKKLARILAIRVRAGAFLENYIMLRYRAAISSGLVSRGLPGQQASA